MLRLEIQLILVDFCPSALRMHGPFLIKKHMDDWQILSKAHVPNVTSTKPFRYLIFFAQSSELPNVFPEMNFTLEIMVWKMYISPPASKNCYFLYYLFLKFSGFSKRSQIPPILGEIIWQVWELIPDLHSNPPPAFQNVRKKKHTTKNNSF